MGKAWDNDGIVGEDGRIMDKNVVKSLDDTLYMYPSGADVRPKFHWGFSYVVICSGYISDCFRVCLGLV